MKEQDREELIRHLSEEFRAVDHPELANEQSYGVEGPEGQIRPEPRKQLVLMLEAFERVLALEDAATLRKATALISEATNGQIPDVRILPLATPGTEANPIAFELAEMQDLRAEARRLIVEILEDDDSTDPFEDSEDEGPEWQA